MRKKIQISSEELEKLISDRTIELQNKINRLESELSISDFKNKLSEPLNSNLNIIFENIRDSIWLMDMNFKTTWVNPSTRFTNGFSFDELENLPLQKRLTPESLQLVQTLISKNITPEKLADRNQPISINEEFEFYKKNGETYWAETFITMLRNSEGVPTGFFGIGRDVTDRKLAEEAIREHEFWIIESQRIAKLGSYIIDYKNDNWIGSVVLDEILGIEEGFNKNVKSWYDLIHPDYHESVLEHLQYSLKNGQTFRKEFKLIRPVDKKEIWMVSQAQLILDTDGKLHKIIGTIQDISEQKYTSEKLSESVELYQSFISATPDAIVMTDLEGVISYIAPKTAELFGYDSAKEIIGKNFVHWIADQDKERVVKSLQLAANHEMPVDNEYLMCKKSGEVFYGEINAAMIFNVNGQGKGFLAIIRDTTERHKSQQQVRFSEEKFAKAFMLSPIGINIIRASDGVYIDVNDTFLKFSLYSRSELIGRSSREVNMWASEENQREFLRQIQENKSVRNFEAIFKNKRGKKLYASISSEILIISNDVCILSISEDITERKNAETILKENELLLREQNEQYIALNEVLIESNERIRKINLELTIAKEKAVEADRLKSAFLANMSHEIRTPMNAILGFAQLLEKKELTKEKRILFTQTIKHRATDLLGIINDIIDISKIESGTFHIFEEPGMVIEMLENIQTFFKIRNENFQKKPIDFRILNHLNYDENYINTDFSRLNQVLINLVENAYKFTAAGYIEIGCSLKDKKHLIFYVKDTGIGISKENQSIIFDRFRQAEDSFSARKYGGTGLGLSISKGILELMNGRIWVESEVGVGTTFFFEIPFKSYEKATKSVNNNDNNVFDWRNNTVLVVEDIEYNAVIIEEFLRSTNITILQAEDGKTAMQLFNEHPEIQLVLMDIRLTDTNGFELTRQMKSLRKDIVIIAQTAYTSNEDKALCMKAGCDGFLMKPISEEDLLRVMSGFLS
jgi:PAS domain S-box-containing protein